MEAVLNSVMSGRETPALPTMTERGANRHPDRVALIAGPQHRTFAELHDAVLRCVAALRATGIGRGDRVGYLGLNSIHYVVLLQAALRIGAVIVPVNWRLVGPEIGFILTDADIALLISEAERHDVIGEQVFPVILTDRALDGQPVFDDWVLAHQPDPALGTIVPGDIAVQLYTSGTTGHPKGALLSHANLAASLDQARLIGESWSAWTNDDVALIAMPQYHIGGTAWTLQALHAGATAVLLARPDIGAIIESIVRNRISKMFAVPAVLGMILDHPDAVRADLGSMRVLLYGASPIPPKTLRRSMAMFPAAGFVQMYGATETSGTIVYLPPEDHDPAGTPRMAGCGKPYPGVELRIVDDAGGDLPTGEVGEVWVRSPLVMAGYHKRPEASARALAGGWYRTGDAGRLDADGYLTLVDRIRDMIVSGAENIYPAEVENALLDHPAVADCAVIAVPDSRWGEAVKAVVVLRSGHDAGEAELIAYARQRIAAYKLPKSIDFATDLPRNAAGKILKRVLREAYWPQAERQVG